MKKIFIILGLAFLTLILCAAGYYLFLTDFGRKNILSADILITETRLPKLEILVTYNIGWWPDQKSLKVDSLKIDIIESKLNLFNSKSIISYKVIGHLEYKGHL